MNIKTGFGILYVILAIIEIRAEMQQNTFVVYITKPLLMILILACSIFTNDAGEVKGRNLFLTGIIFALLGDCFLMVRGTDLFMPGLLSFLIMQWAYIFSFRKDIGSGLVSGRTLVQFLPFAAYAVGLCLILFPFLPDLLLRFSVGVYAASIAVMVWVAMIRHKTASPKSFILVFGGAALFLMSDSLIAINRFLSPVPLGHFWIMGTYASAQYLIFTGMLKTK